MKIFISFRIHLWIIFICTSFLRAADSEPTEGEVSGVELASDLVTDDESSSSVTRSYDSPQPAAEYLTPPLATYQLLHAVKHGHKAKVEEAIRFGANVNACDEISAKSALRIAIESDNTEIVELILKAGASIEYRSRKVRIPTITPAILIGCMPNDDIVHLVDLRKKYGDLLKAIARNKFSRIKKIVETSDRMMKFPWKVDPIIHAIDHTKPAICQYLVHHLIPRQPDRVAKAFFYAVTSNTPEVVVEFLTMRESPGPDTCYHHRYLLHVAIEEGRLEIAQILLEHGASVTLADYASGKTALHLMIENNCHDLISLLHSYRVGIRISPTYAHDTYTFSDLLVIEDSSKLTPVHSCAKSSLETLRHLVSLQNPLEDEGLTDFIDRPNSQGQTLLHTAAQQPIKHKEEVSLLVHYLIAHGAHKYRRDNEGKTPEYFAVAQNNDEIAKLLRPQAAVESIDDLCGITPRIWERLERSLMVLTAGKHPLADHALILTGHAGIGKTKVLELLPAMARKILHTDCTTIKVEPSELASSPDQASYIKKIFDDAALKQPSIIIFDNIEGSFAFNSVALDRLAQCALELDKCKSSSIHTLLAGATTNIEHVHPSITHRSSTITLHTFTPPMRVDVLNMMLKFIPWLDTAFHSTDFCRWSSELALPTDKCREVATGRFYERLINELVLMSKATTEDTADERIRESIKINLDHFKSATYTVLELDELGSPIRSGGPL
jgi:ankyrin repeat protein